MHLLRFVSVFFFFFCDARNCILYKLFAGHKFYIKHFTAILQQLFFYEEFNRLLPRSVYKNIHFSRTNDQVNIFPENTITTAGA